MPGLLVDPYQSFPAGGGGLGPYVPAGRTLGAHRYWRMNITTNRGGGFLAIAEMELRTTFGGADVTGSGTAIASGSNGGAEVPASAFDNNTGTNWAVAGSAAWIGYDFGAGNDKDIREIKINMPSSGTSNFPKDFSLDWSDDGSVWTKGLICSVSLDDWGGASGNKLFAIPVVSYRCNVSADVSSGQPAIATFAIAATAAGADATQAAGAGHATGTSEVFAFSEYAFDNNTGTSAQSSVTNAGTFEYHFSSAITFYEARLTVGAVNSSNPKTFKFQASVDGGQNWTDILSPPNVLSWVALTPQTFVR